RAGSDLPVSPTSETPSHRRLSETTVIGHLERLANAGTALELERLLPDAERLSRMEEAFEACGSAYLRPVREYLGEGFTYEELRLARIHLRQSGLKDSP
ncbi:MAG: helix-turn-helix domain-containing protein, partial [Chloroflexota bacterium]|nr:helix-turn-helix domain-containing protein [Chloroflexota bacterium]